MRNRKGKRTKKPRWLRLGGRRTIKVVVQGCRGCPYGCPAPPANSGAPANYPRDPPAQAQHSWGYITAATERVTRFFAVATAVLTGILLVLILLFPEASAPDPACKELLGESKFLSLGCNVTHATGRSLDAIVKRLRQPHEGGPKPDAPASSRGVPHDHDTGD
jgi:hypothetical protein